LTQVGASHHRIPGFKPEYFWVRWFKHFGRVDFQNESNTSSVHYSVPKQFYIHCTHTYVCLCKSDKI
jgi:hypothetical protein